MAQFRATISGQRGEASRLGSKNSGMRVTCNGWNGGVTVYAQCRQNEDDRDVFVIYATGGSNGAKPQRILGTVDGDGNWVPA
jgi:hypothetical protein